MRTCITCKATKPLTEFGVNRRYTDGIHRSCKECERARRRAFYYAHQDLERERYRKYCQEHPERRRATARKHRYGIAPEVYDLMVEAQGGCCAVCKEVPEKDLHVDHCHERGEIRGLLCGGCNRALGILKEDVQRITALAEYASRFAQDGDADVRRV